MTLNHKHLSTLLRVLCADMIEAAKSGHPGLPLGMADVATVLWTRHLKFNSADPAWQDRDRLCCRRVMDQLCCMGCYTLRV